MAVSYQMRAFRTTVGAQGYVYWVSENLPDNDGSIWEAQTPASGEPTRNKADLTEISINRSYQLVFPADNTTFGTIRLAQDIGGTAADPKVVGLQGKSLDSTVPTTNQGLIYDGSSWKPKTIDNSFVSNAISVGSNKVITSDNSGQFSGVPIPSAPSSTYSVLMKQSDGTVSFQKINQDMIDSGFSINSFSTPSSLFEVGTTVTTPTFSMSYNKTPTSVKINNNYGDPAFPSQEIVTSPFTSFQTSLSVVKNSIATVTFTLLATDGVSSEKTKTINFTWGYKVYYGVGQSWSSLANSSAKLSLINSLTSNIRTARSNVFSATASSSQYIYYVYPASFGAGTFTTNLTGGFDLVESFDVPVNGSNTTYYVYQSTRDNLGLQTVTVT